MKKLDPDVEKRLFKNVFVCKNCKHKIRALASKVAEGKVRCRYCKSKALRPKKLIKVIG
ncbi:MAG: hypothetical protein QW678_00280 [Candidatus Aenigmatarchaeota archaeon]